MTKTIFARYFWRSLILLTLATLTLTLSFTLVATRTLNNQQSERMLAAALRMQSYMRPLLTFQGLQIELSEELRNVLPLIADIGEMRLLLLDTNDQIVLDSDLPEAFSPPRDLIDAPEGLRVPLTVSIQTFRGVEERDVGTIIVVGTQNLPLLRRFFQNWLLMSIIVVLLSAISAYFSARRQAKPLRQMAACARSFGLGDFSARADVSSLKELETAELAGAFNTMAETLERSEELRRGFISDISHEIKTPMTIISGYIDGLLDKTISEKKLEETLLIVKEEVRRLSRLIESAASLSRLESRELELQPKPFNISERSLRILAGFESRIEEKRLDLQLDVTPNIVVFADADRITQVLTNLIDNAVKFSESSRWLKFSIKLHGGDKIRVSIKNCGPEISQKDIPYIFERYYKADQSRSLDKSGLGLGLFICKNIINAHGEEIILQSNDGVTEASFALAVA